MSNLIEKILKYLSQVENVNTLNLSKHLEEDHQKVIGAIKSIQAYGDIIIIKYTVTENLFELTNEGHSIVKNGSYEAIIYNAIPISGVEQSELMKLQNAKIGFSKAMSEGWIKVDKSTGKSIVKKNVDRIIDTVCANLKLLLAGHAKYIPDSIKQEYKKRKLIQETLQKSFVIEKGPEFTLNLSKLETDLTSDMISSGNWRNLQFKSYNFNALGASPDCGYLHPLLKVRSEFRQIFLEMGFTEMPTNNYVESSFWNFDALFQPQQHPARDAHDTFFVSKPSRSTKFPEDYLERVKTVHSEGGYGSIGYRYSWKREEASKNLLRTHTTAVSARMLYKLAQEGFKPTKLFSIDKVFRNETLDATHLAEFCQVEGVIADYNVTLGDLIGVFTEFFKKLGFTELEFKPAYNPYTEPSMEIFCFHAGLGKWIEIGNSGVFRPEMLLPMGLPENVSVIAWGLSLERPTMIKYDLNNIRDLVGPRIDLEMVQKNPICRIEK